MAVAVRTPLVVAAPLSGSALALADVPDPVFADALVGPGMAIRPDGHSQIATAPMTGRLVKLKPHAYVVLDAGGRAVLVHLGIDTVKLAGEGFTLLATEGQDVAAGDPVVRWDPAEVSRRGLSPVCPVVALDATAGDIAEPASGHLASGDALFTWA